MTNHSITLKSGRVLDPYQGIIGLAPDADSVFHGYDGHLDDYDEELTPAELVEVADIMLARWQQFRNRCAQALVGENFPDDGPKKAA